MQWGAHPAGAAGPNLSQLGVGGPAHPLFAGRGGERRWLGQTPVGFRCQQPGHFQRAYWMQHRVGGRAPMMVVREVFEGPLWRWSRAASTVEGGRTCLDIGAP